MPTVKVMDIIHRVEDILQDNGVRWPRSELQSWINEAYLSIAALRPDVNAKVATMTCASGTRQDLSAQFPSSLRLLDVTRNLASGSSKKAVRAVQRAILDDQRPAWHTETETENIQHYTFDPRNPKEFFVYPPAKDTAQLEIIYADTPGRHTITQSDLENTPEPSEVILIDDIFMPSMIDWVLYRAYSKDAEYGANEARAAAAYQTFNSALGAQSQADSAANPKDTSSVT